MKLPDDDELYSVDETWLGPPKRYIAPLRHKALFTWVIVGPVAFVIAVKLGLPLNVLTVGLLMLGTMWAAMTLADHVGPERPVSSLFAAFYHDLSAPRGRRTTHQSTNPTRPRSHLGRKHK
jgi:hypothetical protein